MNLGPDQLEGLLQSLKQSGGFGKMGGIDYEDEKIISLLSSIPSTPIPRPIKTTRYEANLGPVRRNFAWKLWITMGATALVFVTLTLVAFGSQNSLPGQKLFAVKRAVEKTQLAMTLNSESKAQLQLHIAEKRLRETQEILSGPMRDPELELAALTELQSQTNKALNAVSKSGTELDESKPLLATLSAIKTELQDIPEATSSAQTLVTDARVAKIKDVIAANNDETLTTITNESPIYTASGSITSLKQDKLVLGQISYKIQDYTTITLDGNPVTVNGIAEGIQATVKYKKGVLDLLLESVSATSTKPKGQNQIEVTSSTSATSTVKVDEQPSTSEESAIINDVIQPRVYGRILIEDPQPLYPGN